MSEADEPFVATPTSCATCCRVFGSAECEDYEGLLSQLMFPDDELEDEPWRNIP